MKDKYYYERTSKEAQWEVYKRYLYLKNLIDAGYPLSDIEGEKEIKEEYNKIINSQTIKSLYTTIMGLIGATALRVLADYDFVTLAEEKGDLYLANNFKIQLKIYFRYFNNELNKNESKKDLAYGAWGNITKNYAYLFGLALNVANNNQQIINKMHPEVVLTERYKKHVMSEFSKAHYAAKSSQMLIDYKMKSLSNYIPFVKMELFNLERYMEDFCMRDLTVGSNDIITKVKKTEEEEEKEKKDWKIMMTLIYESYLSAELDETNKKFMGYLWGSPSKDSVKLVKKYFKMTSWDIEFMGTGLGRGDFETLKKTKTILGNIVDNMPPGDHLITNFNN
jgi:hypothetical protein